MAGLADMAASMLVSAQNRLEVISGNVSNLNSPGFRSRKVFQRILDARDYVPVVVGASPEAVPASALKATANPLDIAITGTGTMLLRAGGRLVPVVSAQLHRDGEGRLVDAAGRALQGAGGGDIVLSDDQVTVLKDGTMLVGGQAEARIGAFSVDRVAEAGLGGNIALQAIPEEAEGAVLHQGTVVPSNVDLGAEMVEMTKASRIAETGARVFQIHDDLIGRVVSKLGEVGR